MPYILEPYNAYQKPPRKKHWMEIVEEEELMHRIALEEQLMAQRKAAVEQLAKQSLIEQQAIKINADQNLALLSQKTQPSSQQVQDGSDGYSVNAGAGGVPPHDFFVSQGEIASFTVSPSSGIGPLAVSFNNTTVDIYESSFYWNFGSGSLTSTSPTPSPLTYTALGTYTVTLQATSSTGASTSATNTITVNPPTVTPAFSSSNPIGAHPLSIHFDANSSTTNGIGTLSFYWNFGSGSNTTNRYSSSPTPTPTYTAAGTYSVVLSVTESYYGIAAQLTSASMVVVS